MNRWTRWWPVACLGFILIAGFADYRQRSLVNWSDVRAVVLQSDDWGLRGFVPDQMTLQGLDKAKLGGTHFPEIYWQSTLEDSVDVADMMAILLRHRGRDDQPAVFQPNMILSKQSVASSPATAADKDSWQTDPRYLRPGLDQSIATAIAVGVWQPELHGLHHFDPADRRHALSQDDGDINRAFQLGVLVFPGSHHAYELGPQRSLEDVRDYWDGIDARFEEEYGQPFSSVIAGDYVWEPRHEEYFRELGVRAIQAKSHQRRRDIHGPALWKRLSKAWLRSWDRFTVNDIVYLDRVALLETAQSSDPEHHRRQCVRDVEVAWQEGRPAIIETHRVNYVLTDTNSEQKGRTHLDQLLTELDSRKPLYVSDSELVGMIKRGCSVVRRGSSWLIRNPGSASRLAVITPHSSSGSQQAHYILIPAKTTLLLSAETKKILEHHSLD